jgi:DNA-binding IclR family transcriptional regulator
MASRGVVQTLDRGLRVLELLAEANDGLTVGEIAARMGIHRASAYRLVSTLEACGYVLRRIDGRYCLWMALLELSRRVLPELRALAMPILDSLADDIGATAHLTVLDGEEAVTVAVVEPRRTQMHIVHRPGLRHSVHVGASGRAILATRPPEPDEAPEIAAVREAGYAESYGELYPGAIGIAAPVAARGYAGEASIGVVALAQLPASAPARVIAAAKMLAEVLA